MKTWYSVQNLAADTAEVRIYDDIGGYGVSAKQFCADLNAIKAAKIDLRINSYGGEVFDAAAICTAIREHAAEVTAHVDGIAASAASVVACACDSVQIGKSAFLMIHNPISMAFGNAAEMRKTADTLDKLGDSIAGVYCDKTGKTADVVKKAMDDETWFDAQEAVEFGLADSVKQDDDDDDDDDENDDTPADRLIAGRIGDHAPFLLAQYRNMPDRLRRIVAAAIKGQAAPGRSALAKSENAMLNVISREGKHFVAIGDKEHEITLPTPAGNPTAKGEVDITAAVEAAKAEAIKSERAYRAMFNTAVASAGLTGDAAAKFETEFYGYDEKQIKFLAQHAIAARALAVGEGSGMTEEQLKALNQKDPAAAIVAEAGKRFDEEPSLRRAMGAFGADVESDLYKTKRASYVAAAKRNFLAASKK